MAYTRVWSNNTPLGSASASSIDDEIRNHRQDVQERMDTLLGAGKWATDPVATLTGKTFRIAALGAVKGSDSANVGSYNPLLGGLTLTGIGTVIWYVPIILPVGCTLQALQLQMNNEADEKTEFTLYNINNNAVANAVADSSVAATLSLNALARVVAANEYYYAEIKLTSRSFGVAPSAASILVTYDVPNLVVCL